MDAFYNVARWVYFLQDVKKCFVAIALVVYLCIKNGGTVCSPKVLTLTRLLVILG